VKETWQDRQALYAGSGEAAPEENVSELLEALASDFERSEAPAGVVADLAAKIRALAGDRSVPKIEEGLIDIERELMDRILASMSEDDRNRLVEPITAIVADLDDKTRQRTYEANLRRAVREKFSLPRLTLFR